MSLLKTLGKQSKFGDYVENLSELEEAVLWIETAEKFFKGTNDQRTIAGPNCLDASKKLIEKVITVLNNTRISN